MRGGCETVDREYGRFIDVATHHITDGVSTVEGHAAAPGGAED